MQALVRWDPVGHARAQYEERAEVGFPPAIHLAAIDGSAKAIATSWSSPICRRMRNCWARSSCRRGGAAAVHRRRAGAGGRGADADPECPPVARESRWPKRWERRSRCAARVRTRSLPGSRSTPFGSASSAPPGGDTKSPGGGHKRNGKEVIHSLPLSPYNAPGGLAARPRSCRRISHRSQNLRKSVRGVCGGLHD